MDLRRLFCKSFKILRKKLSLKLQKKMLAWLHCMTHPDGEIAFFNDAAFGVALKPSQLKLYASRVGVKNSLEKSRKLLPTCCPAAMSR